MEGTVGLSHKVASHRCGSAGGVFRLAKQVDEHVVGARLIEVPDSGDVPDGLAHVGAIGNRVCPSPAAQCGATSAQPFDVGADERHQVRHVFGSTDLRDRRRQVGFLLPIEVVETEHEIDAALEVRAEAFPHIVVGDPSGVPFRFGRPC